MRRRARNRRFRPLGICSNAGFTLLEVMVVMTIMGLMMPLIYANISAGVTAWVQGLESVQSEAG